MDSNDTNIARTATCLMTTLPSKFITNKKQYQVLSCNFGQFSCTINSMFVLCQFVELTVKKVGNNYAEYGEAAFRGTYI